MNKADQKHIIIVEDNATFASLLKRNIENQLSCVASVEERGDVAVKRIICEQPGLVVLDRSLPGLDGLLVCQQVRPKYSGPILMITGLGTPSEQIEGLENGADDYIIKPARLDLILAKIKALLRRDEIHLQSSRSQSRYRSNFFSLGSLVVDEENRLASLRGTTLRLTTFEFDLLLHLAGKAGIAVSRQELFQSLRKTTWDYFDRSMDYHILNLRKKLGDDGKNPLIIKSIRGVGYMLVKNP